MSRPYLPIVKAMAPKAPIGAAYMTIRITPKNACPVRSIPAMIGRPRSPKCMSAKANTTEKNSTCRMLPSAKAPTTLLGKMWKMKSYQWEIVPCSMSPPTVSVTLILPTSALTPAPGFVTFMTTSPRTSATVVMSSKYSSAFPPIRPTFFTLSIDAMPATTVQKMTGVMTILIRLTNARPTGSSAIPVSGENWPTRMPATMPTSTQK